MREEMHALTDRGKKNISNMYNHGQKLYGQLRKTALSLTPQAMHNQFKRPSAGSVREL